MSSTSNSLSTTSSESSSKPLMKISEFAKKNHLSARALRLYEEQGLLTPVKRSEGGFRFYKADQALRLNYIQSLQDLGCSLSEIKEMMQQWQTPSTAGEGMKALEQSYRQYLDHVRHIKTRLKKIEDDLIQGLAFLEGCQECNSEQSAQESCPQCDRVAEGGDLIVGITQR